jgi:hypothetical protein
MHEASKAVVSTARLTGFENEEYTHGCLLFPVREVPFCSRFTY